MSQKKEFVFLSSQPGSNISDLCNRFGISRPTGYKWLSRFRLEGEAGLSERSRRPHHSPRKVDAIVEELVLAIRDERPTWGARKIKRCLEDLGAQDLPSPSTITEILRRNDRLDPKESVKNWKRFERESPMEMLQMDFKGHFKTASGRCHPLTLLDDHSRYLLELRACGNEEGGTVKAGLQEAFRRYGLPDSIITDNGPPWGMSGHPSILTGLGLWLIRLGIRLRRAGAYHPQTMGKIERMHRTLKAEVIQGRHFRTLGDCQNAFDEWRVDYNCNRPHDALGMSTPVERFQISAVPFPEKMPDIEYSPGDQIRKVNKNGVISFKGRQLRVGRGLHGEPVAVRQTEESVYDVVYVRQVLGTIDFRDAPLGGIQQAYQSPGGNKPQNV
jgi:transposase InsO family protein